MSQASTLAVGSKVGRYSLVAEAPEALAAASFVGRAEDGSLARLYQVPRAGVDAEATARAASSAKSLTHANICRAVSVEPMEGRLGLLFEHVEGVSLQSLVSFAGASGLSRKVALRICVDALEGLSAAHAAGLAHGELGPHLIWVGADGRSRVLGVALAKILGKALAPKTTSDRLAYVAAERVKAAAAGGLPAVDQKCDVFSVAVIAWELLARQRLFSGRLESAVIQKVLTGPVAPLAATADDIADEVDDALKKALERDPAKRTATAREFADALTAAFGEGLASHEEVGQLVEELAKKPLTDLRARLSEAGALGHAGELVVPPPRAPIPTLDEMWVQSVTDDAAKPIVKTPSVRPPPPPPPKVQARPKVPDAKAPSSSEGALAKVAGVKIETKSSAANVDAKAPQAKAPDAKATDAKAESAESDAKAKLEIAAPAESKASADVSDNPSPSVTAAPKVRVNPAAVVPRLGASAKRGAEPPRKATLLGLAVPLIKADAAEKADASKAKDVADLSETPATPKPEAVTTASDAAEAKAPDVAAEAAATASSAETAAEPPPPSKHTPTLGTGSKPPADPDSSSPASMSLADRKKRALPGELKPGDTLGRYELLLPVASGGMATVWAARLQGTAGFQKTVAIKTMLPGLSSDQDFEEMFLDEARVAARIRHPNVVEIFDLGEEGETLYLVMEWVDGETVGTLQKGAKSHGGVPMPILLRLASQVCAGLHAAHELRDDKGALVDLVHRDISPANILVSRTGFVKIVDFGVAKSKARMYTTRVGGMIKGKTPYLSPEQLGGLPIDRRSDLYSFGAVLYVLATGLHPFRGENDAKTIENIALRDPVSLCKLDPSIPPEFEAIVLKALAKDRDKRFESASEMQRAIDGLAASIGQTVNDDDVAAFVRKVSGPSLEKRTAALRDAIALADTGKPPIQPRYASSSDASKDGPASASTGTTPASSSAAAAASDEAVKVDIDEVDVDADVAPSAAAKPIALPATPAPKEADPLFVGAPIIPPPPDAPAVAMPPLTAPSLGSDSSPDTLAAASTGPDATGDIAPPRRRGPALIVGGVLGLCAIIGIIAIAGMGGGSESGSGAAARPAATEPARTAQPTVTEAPGTNAAPAPEPPASSAVAATPTPPATPSGAATAEPEPTAEPTTTPPPAIGFKPKPSVATRPIAAPAQTLAVKPIKPTPKQTPKPPKKFEPTGL